MKTINVYSASELNQAIGLALADGAKVSSVVLTYPTPAKKSAGLRRFTVKRAIIITSLALVLAVISITSVQAYNSYRVRRDVTHAAAVTKAKAAAAQAWAVQRAHNAQIASLKNQCAKDHQLFVASRGKSAAGDCDPNLLAVQ